MRVTGILKPYFEDFMKTPMIIVSILVSFLMPYPGFAAFLVELTSGATYVTDRYWEEDGRIRFRQYGGTIGFSKNHIREIKKTDKEYIDATRGQKSPAKENNTGAQTAKDTQGGSRIIRRQEGLDKKKELQPFVLSAYQEKKNEITHQYAEAKNKLSQTIKNRDRVAQQAAAREISRIERKRARIAQEIREKNDGVLPSWWQRKNEVD